MTYTFIDHGNWVRYTPSDEQRGSAPAGAMFCKRESDDADWYVYSRDKSSWKEGSAKITVNLLHGQPTIQVAVYNPDHMFPSNCQLFEVIGYTGTDPRKDLESCSIDVSAETITPVVRVDPSAFLQKADLWRRATDDEAETIVQAIGKLSLRKQRLFGDTQLIDPQDPEFAELKAALVAAFGEDRTAQLLAPSAAS